MQIHSHRPFLSSSHRTFSLCCGCLLLLILPAVGWSQGQLPRAQQNPLLDPTLDPTIRIVLESEPETTAELVRTLRLLLDLDAARYARPYLQQLMDQQYTDEEYAALIEEFGADTFMEFRLSEEIGPATNAWVSEVFEGAQRHHRSPARIAALIDQLKTGSNFQQAKAISGLSAAGSAAFGPLLGVLKDPAQAEYHPAIRTALARMTVISMYPLLAALESDDPAFRAEIYKTFAQTQAYQAGPFFLRDALSEEAPQIAKDAARGTLRSFRGLVPSQDRAVELLIEAALAFRDQSIALELDDSNMVEGWSWDQSNNSLLMKPMNPRDVYAIWTARLLEDAKVLAPEHPTVQRLYLAAKLEAAQYEAGLGTPVSLTPENQTWLEGVSPELLLQVIENNLSSRHTPAAAAALSVLKEVGSADLLLERTPGLSRVVLAANSPDIRVRLAAMETIAAWNPPEPYPGCSFVLRMANHLMQHNGRPLVVIVDPIRSRAQQLGGLILDLGYDVQTASTGQEGFKFATVNRCQLILVASNVAIPGIELTLSQFRHDPRTYAIPIGIYGKLDQEKYLLNLSERTARSRRILVAIDPPSIEFQIQELLALTPDAWVVLPKEGMEMAERAFAVVAKWSEERTPKYDLKPLISTFEHALFVPQLASSSMKILSNLGTRESQLALIEIAGMDTRPILLRQEAADSFAKSVKKFGTLLTTDEVVNLYDRYNRSEIEPIEVQELLGLMLDAIEEKAKDFAGNQPLTDVPVREVDE
ncbi:Hypothetical protein PBC10988_37950 [Planctomycetales bacterium 10988]|nr:Hypothetical protein PBC10988_37950 [Planctomycetales bacterium 10988]